MIQIVTRNLSRRYLLLVVDNIILSTFSTTLNHTVPLHRETVGTLFHFCDPAVIRQPQFFIYCVTSMHAGIRNYRCVASNVHYNRKLDHLLQDTALIAPFLPFHHCGIFDWNIHIPWTGASKLGAVCSDLWFQHEQPTSPLLLQAYRPLQQIAWTRKPTAEALPYHRRKLHPELQRRAN